jgi:UDP-2,3-diacylglucosamine pyrophosphatase LpxH
MIVFVSDLHLSDTVERSTFNTDRFLDWLKATIEQAAKNNIETITLVLLGDIFEILRSRAWIDKGIRPWDAPRAEHLETVLSILGSIVASNPDFFAELRRLTETKLVDLTYLPGNHDRPLNIEMGSKARLSLRQELPLGEIGDRTFKSLFLDSHH